MGLIIGLLKRIFKLLIYFGIFVAIVLVIPNLPPYTKFTEIKVEPTLPRTGVLSPNGALNNAQKLFTGKIIGPEAFRIFNNELYTGLATGEVVKISPSGHITFVTKIGQPCTGLFQEHVCGRPLGLDIDEKNNLLYVADSYYGIWKVNLKTEKKQLLVSPNVEIDGKKVKTFNGVTLDKNGNLYWTHSSSDFDLKDGAMTCLADPSGRLLYYNSAKNQSEVLLDNLWFANGVAISPDNEFVLVAESGHYRIKKYFINGPKKGKSEVFVAGLPGVPDNFRVLPDGSGILAALYVVIDDETPLIMPPPLKKAFSKREYPSAPTKTNQEAKKIPPSPKTESITTNKVVKDKVKVVEIKDIPQAAKPSVQNTPLSNKQIKINQGMTGGKKEDIEKSKAIETEAKSKPVEIKPIKKETETKPKPVKTQTIKQKTESKSKPIETKTIKEEAEIKTKSGETKTENQIKPKSIQSKEVENKKAPNDKTPTTEQDNVKIAKETINLNKKVDGTQKLDKDPKQKHEKQNNIKSKPVKVPHDKLSEPKFEAIKTSTEKPNVHKVQPKPTPDQIPVREDIPSERIKPPKETLKVIKKSGPVEIPNPN
ncbi:unnamed protein product, partial [Iphiclides podalirius]